MDDLISRSALYDALKDLADKTDCDIAILPDVTDLIREAPAIDPESLRPHERLERREDGVGYRYACTICGEEIPHNFRNGWYFSNYCPNCGARMDLPDQVLAPADQPAAQYADDSAIAEA